MHTDNTLIDPSDTQQSNVDDLKNQVEFLTTIIDNSYNWIIFRNNLGKITYINQSFERITGFSKDDLLTGKISEKDIIHPEDWPGVQIAIKTILKTHKQVKDLEFRIITQDGAVKIINVYAMPVFKDNAFIGIRTSASDITDQKRLLENQELISKVERSENRFRRYLEYSPNAVLIFDKTKKYQFVNRVACQMTGYTESEFLEQQIPFPFTGGKTIDAENFQTLQSLGEAHNLEIQIQTKRGKSIDVVLDAVKLSENEYLAFVKDITELKKTESKLRDKIREFKLINRKLHNLKENAEESETRFKALHNASFGGISIHDKGLILDCNQGLSEMTGYSLEELTGMDGLNLIATRSRKLVMQKILSGIEKPYEAFGLRKNGEEFPMRLEARNIPYKGKMVRAVEFRDITDQKEAERKIELAMILARENELKYKNQVNFTQALIKHLPIPLFYKNADGYYLGCNPAYETFTGMSKEFLKNKTVFDLWDKDLATTYFNQDNELLKNKDDYQTYEYAVKDTKNEFRDVIFNKAVFFNENNEAAGIVGVISDITERKKTEAMLRQNTERLQILYNLSKMSDIDNAELFNFALEKSIELCNSKIGFLGVINEDETLIDVHAWSESAMKSCKIKDKTFIFEVGERGLLGEVIRKRKPFILNDYTTSHPAKKGLPAGHVSLKNYLSVPVFDKDKIALIIAVGNKETDYNETDMQQLSLLMEGVYNIIKRKKYEQDLIKARNIAQESEEKHRFLLENMTQGVIYHSGEGKIIYSNQAASKILNLSSEKLKDQKTYNIAGTLIDENEKPLSPEDLPNMIVMNTGNAIKDFKVGILSTSYEPDKWVSISAAPGFSELSGKPSLIIVTLNDITYEINAEKEKILKAKLEKKIAISEASLKFKQNFLANMSHEIRTPLTGILGMAEILKNTTLNPDQKDYLNTLMQSGDNLKEVINQVLDFSKIEAGKMRLRNSPFPLDNIANKAKNLFQSICRKEIKFEAFMDDELPAYVTGDEVRIMQIITNLISNAVKFTEKGKIRLHIAPDKWHSSTNEIDVRVTVSDTGKGISEDMLHKLFKPFSQIDDNDTRHFEGTGLGLSICKELVKLHGGKIDVTSQLDKGSVFSFTFRAEKADPSKWREAVNEKIKSVKRKRLRILLAEDMIVNQKVFKVSLTTWGHSVTLAKNGEEVLNSFRPGEYDLILMDIKMPVLDGISATRKLRESHKNLPPIVGLSANAFEGDRERYMSKGLDDYLTKPLNYSEFNKMVERVIINPKKACH
jgi:PAS domain S-box-containing protein